MNAIDLHDKLDLITDKIENIERSGRFTEREIDSMIPSLKMEKELYEKHLNQYIYDINVNDAQILSKQLRNL